MRRKNVLAAASLMAYGIVCGAVLGALYVKATVPTAGTADLWFVYLFLGLCPAAVVFWLPRNQWIRLSAVAAALAIELIALHLTLDCRSSDDCLATTLAATALPFFYLYCLVSAPVAILASSLIDRGGSKR